MKSWLDFEERFRRIATPLGYFRIDFQWGDSGEFWNLQGLPSGGLSREFNALAELAGLAVMEVATTNLELQRLVAKEKEPKHVWYRALKELTNDFQHGICLTQHNESDDSYAGTICTGSIPNIGEVSANLCLTLHARCPMPITEEKISPMNTSSKVNDDTDKIPKSLWEVILHFFWPPQNFLSKIILAGTVIIFVCFTIWTSLPEKSKNELISLKSGFANLKPELIRPANGQTLDNFPRKTVLEWKPLRGAVRYVVEIELQDIKTGAWHPIPWARNRLAVEETKTTIIFTGAQPGRWRVSAINNKGVKSNTSEWWEFFYIR